MLIYLCMLTTEEKKSKFEQIYNNYRYTMFYVAKDILKDDFLAEDAVHDAFINIAKSIDNISDANCMRSKRYVIIIVRNISLNILKKQKNIINVDNYEERILDDLSLEECVISKLSFDFIVEKILALPIIYKDVLYLSYVEELGTKEISKIINIPNETVKKRLQRGRKKLAETLDNGSEV